MPITGLDCPLCILASPPKPVPKACRWREGCARSFFTAKSATAFRFCVYTCPHTPDFLHLRGNSSSIRFPLARTHPHNRLAESSRADKFRVSHARRQARCVMIESRLVLRSSGLIAAYSNGSQNIRNSFWSRRRWLSAFGFRHVPPCPDCVKNPTSLPRGSPPGSAPSQSRPPALLADICIRAAVAG